MAKVVTIPTNVVPTEIELHLNKKDIMQTVYSQQYDTGLRYIKATIYNNGVVFPLTSDYTINFECTKPDSFGVDNIADIDKDGNIIYQITEDTTAKDGWFDAQFKIFDTKGGVVTTPKFKMYVDKSALSNETIVSTPEFNVLNELIKDANEVITTIGDIATSESIRVSNEAKRKSNESTRISSENTRVLQEKNRESQETSRVNAESSRATAEAGRVKAELTRVSDEKTRISAETDRKSAENTRKSNENTRQSQENTRQQYFNAYRVCESYSSTKAYVPGNKVVYQGSTYQNIMACTNILPTVTANWILIAAKGIDGVGGDMFKNYYDPQGKSQDIFEYADQKATYQDKGTATGEFVTFENADDALAQVNIKGKSTQVSTKKGKNLLPSPTKTETISGITFTVNADGTLTLNGTSTGNFNYFIIDDSTPIKPVLEVGTYTMKKTGKSEARLSIRKLQSTDAYRVDTTDYTFTLTESFTIGTCFITITSGAIFNNYKIEPQIESGSSSTTYEKYSVDSPSPDYPSPIVSPLNFDLVSCGVNLFNDSKRYGSSHPGSTYDPLTRSYISTSGTIWSVAFQLLQLQLNPNTKYVIQSKVVMNGTICPVGIYAFDGYNQNVSLGLVKSTDKESTLKLAFTTGLTGKVEIRMHNNASGTAYDGVNNVWSNIQLELGSTATAYTPYKEDKINIPLDMGEWNEIKDGNYINGMVRLVPDATTNWLYHGTQPTDTSLVRFYLPDFRDIKLSSRLMCTHFIFNGVAGAILPSLFLEKEGCISHVGVNQLSVIVKKERISGWSESLTNTEKQTLFKNYITSLGVVFFYEPVTPTITPLNTYLKTFKGVTNIFTNATPQPEITATFKPQLWADLYNHQNAINSKIDDKKRVNNLLSTDPTTVLSGAMGKQLKDEIDATNNNMPKQINYWSDTQKNLLAKINDVSDPTFRTVIINGWDSVFTDSDMPYRNTVWHIAIYNNGRDINVWQRWTNLDNGSIYMRLYNPSSSSWGNWINNDLKSVTYTGTTESYATPNGKYAYLALPVAKDSAKNLLVNVVNDEYIVHATYHNAYNWLALITKVDDIVPLSTSLTVNYTLIN